jgi:hypothetical protein
MTDHTAVGTPPPPPKHEVARDMLASTIMQFAPLIATLLVPEPPPPVTRRQERSVDSEADLGTIVSARAGLAAGCGACPPIAKLLITTSKGPIALYATKDDLFELGRALEEAENDLEAEEARREALRARMGVVGTPPVPQAPPPVEPVTPPVGQDFAAGQ